MGTYDERENVREQHRPAHVAVLFVGESPPASGGFFYFGSGIVFSSTQRAFRDAFRVSFDGPAEFLRFFRDAGCFLDDLSHAPVDHLPQPERWRALDGCVEAFAARLRVLAPTLVVVFLKKISPLVERAAALAGIASERVCALPFPGNGNQNRYVAQLVGLLPQALARGLISPPPG